MIEAVAISLFILANSIVLAPAPAQLAAWNAQPAQMQAAYVRQAQFLLAPR